MEGVDFGNTCCDFFHVDVTFRHIVLKNHSGSHPPWAKSLPYRF